jgi:hypothetical protein
MSQMNYFQNQITGLDENTPLLVGQMVPSWIRQHDSRKGVDKAHKNIPNLRENTAFVSAETPTELGLNDEPQGEPDLPVHYSASGLRTLGKRYYQEFKKLVEQENPQPPTNPNPPPVTGTSCTGTSLPCSNFKTYQCSGLCSNYCSCGQNREDICSGHYPACSTWNNEEIDCRQANCKWNEPEKEQVIATYLFTWHKCPTINCRTDQIPFVAPGMAEPYPEGGYYAYDDVNWYKRELQDMEYAGVNTILLVTHHTKQPIMDPKIRIEKLQQAMEETGISMKIGLLMDDLVGDFSNEDLARQEYESQIKPVYDNLDRKYWNVIDEKPVITAWTEKTPGSSLSKHSRYGHVLFGYIKNRFKQDYGIEPVIMPNSAWTRSSLDQEKMKRIAEGETGWTADFENHKPLIFDDWKNSQAKSLVIASVTPGIHMDRCGWCNDGPVEDRLGGKLYSDIWDHLNQYQNIQGKVDIIILETWNELFEGTGISRADYSVSSGERDTLYLEISRQKLGLPNKAPPSFE